MDIYVDILQTLNDNRAAIDAKTDRIKLFLGELGEVTYACAVLAHGNNERFQVEWLYDMVWYRPIKTPEMEFENPAEFVLVLESELSKFNLQGFREDFDKLLIANAPHRVMIFSDRPNLSEAVLTYAEKAVENCRNLSQGDSVAIILYDDCNTGLYRMKVLEKQ